MMTMNPMHLIKAGRQSLPPAERKRTLERQALWIAPLAWLKLRMFLHADEVEVGGFGVSAAGDLLYIEDFVAPKQHVTAVTVELEDDAVADHFDKCADAGISPARAGRCWIHTHPSTSPLPSMTDEETFERVFGGCDWAAMIIVARGGASYVRLRFNMGPGGEVLLPLEVDWERFPGDLLDREGTLDQLMSGWMEEYGQNVHPRPLLPEPPIFKEYIKQDVPAHAFAGVFDGLDDLYDFHLMEEDYISWAESLEEEVAP